MGQYHMTVNLDKREFINPHGLGDGLKLWEQVGGPGGVGSALIVLLAASNGRGGGDFSTEYPDLVGRWAGDRIAIVGDYAEVGDLPAGTMPEVIFDLCGMTEDDRDRIIHWHRTRAAEYAENDKLEASAHHVMLAEFFKTAEPYTDLSPRLREFFEATSWIGYRTPEWASSAYFQRYDKEHEAV